MASIVARRAGHGIGELADRLREATLSGVSVAAAPLAHRIGGCSDAARFRLSDIADAAMARIELSARISLATLPPKVREAASAALIDPDAEARLVADGFIESYVYWREACEDVHATYECWGTCKSPARMLAFGSHRAALDREEHAAGIHASWAD
jgi:hypothetical protein